MFCYILCGADGRLGWAIASDHIEIQVRQTFGNCLKYIQARQVELATLDSLDLKPVHNLTILKDADRQMIQFADPFCITTAYLEASAGNAKGVDVSHRGGNPGFVRINGDTLTVPNFAGNGFFNTFGNLDHNPQAGLLFIDFERGHLLYLSGRADVVWDGDPDIADYAGAERLFKFHLTNGICIKSRLPLTWSMPEYSRFLAKTDS